MNHTESEPLTVNGWRIFGHSLFLAQVEELTVQVEMLRRKDPAGYRNRNAAKRLAAIAKLAFEIIPQNPALAEYRLGGALGDSHRHWFRAKFFQQYRLFFRYHSESRVIVYGWVNDETTKRAFNSRSDAYQVFRKMLNSGHPPDDWDSLMKESRQETERIRKISQGR